MGWPLRHLTKCHPNIDFVFRSHSSAGPYPWCVSSEFSEDLKHRSNQDYCEEFFAFSVFVGARYAVPFASNHCFLHKETNQFNSTAVSPADVKKAFEGKGEQRTECKVMIPGDSWSDTEGFAIQSHDYFDRRNHHIDALASKHKSTLTNFYAQEEKVEPHWPSFERYFSTLLRALPRGFSLVFPLRVAFKVFNDRTTVRWLVDFENWTLLREVTETDVPDMEISVHANVLRDCCQKRMFSVFTASKRLHFHLYRKRALRGFFIFNQLMDMYESDYFPVRLWFRRRFVVNWLRRWREVAFYVVLLISVMLGKTGRLRPTENMQK
jgi:UDP-MurNAc hydroxylase